jgi:anti-anti-sigma regulatory factor
MAGKKQFGLRFRQNKDNLFFRLRGKLDGSGACQVEHALDRLRDVSNHARLTVDLSEVREFDYFGIVHFAKVIRGRRYRFREISLSGLGTGTERLFKRFGLANGKVTRFQI